MPEEEKKTVPIDTSGPDATVDIEETKDESVIETEAPKEETTEQETTQQEKKEDDNKLEDYSKGVQARIAKLTRNCLLYTSPSPRDVEESRMPSSA